MLNLSKYSNILGEPGTGAHKYRLFSVAIVDVIMTIIGGILISRVSGWPLWIVLAVLFLSGILLHRLFSVRTTVDKLLFP
jgi:hypothetical protein